MHPMWMATHSHMFSKVDKGHFGVSVFEEDVVNRSNARGVNIRSPLCGSVQEHRMTIEARYELLGRIIKQLYISATGYPTVIRENTDTKGVYKIYLDRPYVKCTPIVVNEQQISDSVRKPTYAELFPNTKNIKLFFMAPVSIHKYHTVECVFETPDSLYSSCYEPKPIN